MFLDFLKDIEQAFLEYISLYPMKKNEILDEEKKLCGLHRAMFMKLYTQMPFFDIISLEPRLISEHAEGVLKAYENMSWCRDIPEEIFLDFVLPYRVNDEAFCLYNAFFYPLIADEVKDKSIAEAVKYINYLCLSFASYEGSDDRTKNALTTLRSGKGRCGEESVLLVSALRSVGIPARQVYVPFWSHCDDNHAWVEVFTGEKWQYLGACEPEDCLDTGWFDHAASKAPLVRYRKFGIGDRSVTRSENRIFETVNVTSRYAGVKTVTVKTEPFAKVGVYTVNYGRISLIDEKTTGGDGLALFETGICDLLYFALFEDGISVCECRAEETEVELYNMENIKYFSFDLSPGKGVLPGKKAGKSEDERKSFEHFDALRRTRLERLGNMPYGDRAGENYTEIESFLKEDRYSEKQKLRVLETLSLKDYSDVTRDTLLDACLAFEYEDEYPSEIFDKYILPQRVENEPLTPFRAFIKGSYRGKIGAKEIYAYVLTAGKRFDSFGYGNTVEDIESMVKYSVTSDKSVGINFVRMCRALGIPARLDGENGCCLYYDGAGFVPVFAGDEKSARISLLNKAASKYVFGESLSVAKIDDIEGIINIDLTGEVDRQRKINLTEGFYVVTESKRQLDGSVNGHMTFVWCKEDGLEEVILTEIKDKTRDLLLKIPIAEEIEWRGGKEILAYIECGEEPTAHLLSELIENKDRLEGVNITLFCKEETSCGLLKEVVEHTDAAVYIKPFDEHWDEMRRLTGTGDLRMPFIMAAKNGECLCAFANYNVGTVPFILKTFEYPGDIL